MFDIYSAFDCKIIDCDRNEFLATDSSTVSYTLKGTIRQLLDKPEVQDIGNKEIIKRLANASAAVPEDKLKDMIYHNFIIEINNDDDE